MDTINHKIAVFSKCACLFIYGFASLVVGCDSPRNNRVLAGEPLVLSQTQSLKFDEFNYSASFFWSQGPYPEIFKTSKLIVFVYNEDGQLTDLPADLSLNFFTIMPSMGHGAEDTGYFQNIAEGVYENPSIVFQMPGDWQMQLSILDTNFKELDRVVWLEFF
jgi:hypothetical protein